MQIATAHGAIWACVLAGFYGASGVGEVVLQRAATVAQLSLPMNNKIYAREGGKKGGKANEPTVTLSRMTDGKSEHAAGHGPCACHGRRRTPKPERRTGTRVFPPIYLPAARGRPRSPTRRTGHSARSSTARDVRPRSGRPTLSMTLSQGWARGSV